MHYSHHRGQVLVWRQVECGDGCQAHFPLPVSAGRPSAAPPSQWEPAQGRSISATSEPFSHPSHGSEGESVVCRRWLPVDDEPRRRRSRPPSTSMIHVSLRCQLDYPVYIQHLLNPHVNALEGLAAGSRFLRKLNASAARQRSAGTAARRERFLLTRHPAAAIHTSHARHIASLSIPPIPSRS